MLYIQCRYSGERDSYRSPQHWFCCYFHWNITDLLLFFSKFCWTNHTSCASSGTLLSWSALLPWKWPMVQWWEVRVGGEGVVGIGPVGVALPYIMWGEPSCALCCAAHGWSGASPTDWCVHLRSLGSLEWPPLWLQRFVNVIDWQPKKCQCENASVDTSCYCCCVAT